MIIVFLIATIGFALLARAGVRSKSIYRGSCLGLLAIPWLFAAAVAASWWYQSEQPTHYTTAADAPIEGLPTSATDIRIVDFMPAGPTQGSCSFACSEEAYTTWVEEWRKRDPRIGPIADHTPEPPLPYSRTIMKITPEGRDERTSTADFLIAEYAFDDSGIHLIYNRETGYATQHIHSR